MSIRYLQTLVAYLSVYVDSLICHVNVFGGCVWRECQSREALRDVDACELRVLQLEGGPSWSTAADPPGDSSISRFSGGRWLLRRKSVAIR